MQQPLRVVHTNSLDQQWLARLDEFISFVSLKSLNRSTMIHIHSCYIKLVCLSISNVYESSKLCFDKYDGASKHARVQISLPGKFPQTNQSAEQRNDKNSGEIIHHLASIALILPQDDVVGKAVHKTFSLMNSRSK